MAAALSAVVNGGTYRSPTLLHSDGNAEAPSARIFSIETADKFRARLNGGMTSVTQKVVAGSYAPNRIVVSAARAFPPDQPRKIVYLMLDEPYASVSFDQSREGIRTAVLQAAAKIEKAGEAVSQRLTD